MAPLRICALAVGLAALWLGRLVRRPFPDRLAVISEDEALIDNVRPYDDPNKWAPNGSQAGLHILNPARVSYFDRRIREMLQPPFRVLDMGCGGGLVTNALARLPGYASIDGVDLSAEALVYAKATIPSGSETSVRFQNASIYELPFEAGAFDAVVLSDVLEHLHDVRRALREAARVLRPGGLFVFDTIDRSVVSFVVAILGAEQIVRIVNQGSHDWRLFVRPEELGTALADAGFGSYSYDAFDPTLQALAELSAFSAGLVSADQMTGSWTIGPPSTFMISYIGSAVKP